MGGKSLPKRKWLGKKSAICTIFAVSACAAETHLDSKLDRYGNKITYDFLKVGQYVDISGTYNITYNEYTFKELLVTEEYLDDYEIYGIVITVDDTIPTSIPLWGTAYDDNSWFDTPNDDEYPCYINN